MDPLKIALIDLNNHIGGGQIALYNVAGAMSKRGHDVELIIGGKIPTNRVQNLPIEDVKINQIRGYTDVIELITHEKKYQKELEKIVDYKKFDVIHIHGITGKLLPKKYDEQLFLTLHGNSKKRLDNLLKFSMYNKYMRNTVYEVPINFTRNVLGHKIHSIIESNICKRAGHVIALTNTEKKYLINNYKVKDDKISIIPNIILNPDSGPDNFKELEDKNIILSVGDLSLIKGTPILVETLKKLLAKNENLLFVSAGDGILRYKLENLQKMYPTNVVICPNVSDVTSLYKKSKLLIHSSIFEAHSLAICEAMKERKPVIAYNVASIPDLIIPDYNGVLCNPVDPQDMAEKTIDLINKEDLLYQMGNNAFNYVETNFNTNKILDNLENLYKGNKNE